MWQNLLAAVALMLVIEGITPFLSPAALRRALAAMMQMSDRALRLAGLTSMAAGVALLYLLK